MADFAHLRSPSRRTALERGRGIFTVEGALALEALVDSPYPVRAVLVDRRRIGSLGDLVARAGAPVYALAPDAVEALTGFAFHRGVLAVAERPAPVPVEEVVAGARRLLVVEAVNDHENLGGLYRNAAAFGVDAVVCDPTTADPLYRRVVRVSLGHVLRVPTARVGPGGWPGALGDLRAAGFAVLALTPAPDAEPVDRVAADPPDRWAVLVGAEGPGLTAGALAGARSEE
ncbi:MAG: TrmH family RNA methyltransferase, partial [Acidimicrobiia bacterium]